MHFSLNVSDWNAHAPGLNTSEQWQHWAKNGAGIDPSAPYARHQHLPVMSARRLTQGSRLALESSLSLFQRHQPDVLLFTSQHGELERNFRILTALAEGETISPTDFALSVHNSAVGSLAIALQKTLVSSSLSAGIDTFQQGLIEAVALMHSGYKKVLLVDFEGNIPGFYHKETPTHWAYATAFIIEPGNDYRCEMKQQAPVADKNTTQDLPQSLAFLYSLINGENAFSVNGDNSQWVWSRQT